MLTLIHLCLHGSRHDLTAPKTITFTEGETWIYCEDGQWADSLEMTDHRCEPPTKSGWVRVTAVGAISTGERVNVVWWEPGLASDDSKV